MQIAFYIFFLFVCKRISFRDIFDLVNRLKRYLFDPLFQNCSRYIKNIEQKFEKRFKNWLRVRFKIFKPDEKHRIPSLSLDKNFIEKFFELFYLWLY